MNRKLGKRKRRMTGEKHNPTANSDRRADDEKKGADAPPVGGSGRDQNPKPAAVSQEPGRAQAANEPLSVKVFALIAAIGGFAAAIFSGLQWHVASDTEVVSNRAIVISNSVNFITYGASLDDPKHRSWLISPIMENVGNTPTVNLQYMTGLALGGNNPNAETLGKMISWRHPSVTRWIRALIGPKASITGARIMAGAEVLQKSTTIPQIAFGVGLVRYWDTFQAPHLLEFCNFIRPFPADFSNYPVGQPIQAHGDACRSADGETLHNCQDDECGGDWKQRATENIP